MKDFLSLLKQILITEKQIAEKGHCASKEFFSQFDTKLFGEFKLKCSQDNEFID